MFSLSQLPIELLHPIRSFLTGLESHVALSQTCQGFRYLYTEQDWQALACATDLSRPALYGASFTWRALLSCVTTHIRSCKHCSPLQAAFAKAMFSKGLSAKVLNEAQISKLRSRDIKLHPTLEMGQPLAGGFEGNVLLGQTGARDAARLVTFGATELMEKHFGVPLRLHPPAACTLAFKPRFKALKVHWPGDPVLSNVHPSSKIKQEVLRGEREYDGYFVDQKTKQVYHTTATWHAAPPRMENKDGLTLLDVLTAAGTLPGLAVSGVHDLKPFTFDHIEVSAMHGVMSVYSCFL